MEGLGVSSAMWRVLKATSVSKSPRCFLFSSDIDVKVAKKEARQRSWERGIGIQEEGESLIELLYRVWGANFLGRRVSHYERSCPSCRGVRNRTWKNLVSNGRRGISTARNGAFKGVVIIKANHSHTVSVKGGARFQGPTNK
jgi:hypothetical protein